MDQLSLFEDHGQIREGKIFNVASVPMRSPFRYPGGKTWLVPYIRLWLLGRGRRPAELIEPFAGGGIVSLTAAFEQLADHATMVERDEGIAAVWQTILEGNAEELASRIAGFDLCLESVREALGSPPRTLMNRAFATILRNRVNRGGILAPGASLVKNGENGRGLSSRWYPQTLAKRIMDIAETSDRITFVEGDGMEVMRENVRRSEAVFFIDPPYTVAAKRLYNHWEIDHEKLFETAAMLSGDFLMTYDNDERVRDLASTHGFETREVAMKNTHHAKMTELLVSRDLSWLRA